jgi:hypothetical protein
MSDKLNNAKEEKDKKIEELENSESSEKENSTFNIEILNKYL